MSGHDPETPFSWKQDLPAVLANILLCDTRHSVPFVIVLSSVCFVVLDALVSLSIWAFKMNFQLGVYTKKSWFGFLTTSLQPTALSFTLFWTLFYGLVYLY